MTTKKQAIEFAKTFHWTGKDAERAFADLNLQEANEQTLLLALVEFAGPQLAERQRLQGAQKAQVTRKNNYIKEMELDFTNQINQFKEAREQETSLFVNIIGRLYKVARKFGFDDPWIEALLSKYQEYQDAA